MKSSRFLFLALAFAGIVCNSSCNKKYICHCNFKYSGAAGLPDSTTKEYDITDTKANAKTKCEGETGTYNNNSITTVETCYLY